MHCLQIKLASFTRNKVSFSVKLQAVVRKKNMGIVTSVTVLYDAREFLPYQCYLKGAFLIKPRLSFSSLYLTSAGWQHSICFIRSLGVKSKHWKKPDRIFVKYLNRVWGTKTLWTTFRNIEWLTACQFMRI